jgi:hypothetical protein
LFGPHIYIYLADFLAGVAFLAAGFLAGAFLAVAFLALGLPGFSVPNGLAATEL